MKYIFFTEFPSAGNFSDWLHDNDRDISTPNIASRTVADMIRKCVHQTNPDIFVKLMRIFGQSNFPFDLLSIPVLTAEIYCDVFHVKRFTTVNEYFGL